MVPSGWKEKKLTELCTKIGDGIHSTPIYTDESDCYFINGNNLKNGTISVSKSTKLVSSAELKKQKIDLHNRSILMSINGTIGNLAKYRGERVLLGKSASYINVDGSNDPNFIYHVLNGGYANRFFNSELSGSTIKNLSLKTIRSLKVLTPQLIEQQRIAKTLSTWDKAITTTEQLLANSQQQKKALMQQLLTGERRVAGASETPHLVRKGFASSKLGALPADWKVDVISKYLWYQEGPGVRNSQFTESGVKLFNGTNIQFNRINLSSTSTHISNDQAYGQYKHFMVSAGDLVIACSGISVDRFDEKIAFIEEQHLPLCMNTSTMRFRPLKESSVDIDYFRYFMMSPLFKNQIRRQITGSAQLNFGPSHVAKCFVVLPPVAEQKAITGMLKAADSELNNIQSEIESLRLEKKALMQQLLTGKRRVKVA